MRKGIGEITAFALGIVIILFASLFIVLSLRTYISSVSVPIVKNQGIEKLSLVRIGEELHIRNSGAVVTNITEIVVLEIQNLTSPKIDVLIANVRTYINCSIDKTVLLPGDVAEVRCTSTEYIRRIPIGVITSRGNVFMNTFTIPKNYIEAIENSNLLSVYSGLVYNGIYSILDESNRTYCYEEELYIPSQFNASTILILCNLSRNGYNILAANNTHRLLIFNLSCPQLKLIVYKDGIEYTVPSRVGVYLCRQRYGSDCVLDISGCSYDVAKLYRVVPSDNTTCSNILPFSIYGDLDGDGLGEVVLTTSESGIYVGTSQQYSDTYLDNVSTYVDLYSPIIEGPQYELVEIHLYIAFWCSRGCAKVSDLSRTIIEIDLIDISTGNKVASANVTYAELCYDLRNMEDVRYVPIKKLLSVPSRGFYRLSLRIYDPYNNDLYNDAEYILSVERMVVLLHVRT